MTEMIAFCGLECDACPAYLATQEDDDEKQNSSIRSGRIAVWTASIVRRAGIRQEPV